MKSILLIFNWHPVVPPANPFIFSFSWSFIHSIRLSLIWKVNLLSETLWPYWAVLLFYSSSVPFHSYLSFNDLLTRIYESTHVVSSDQEGEISIGLSPAFFSSEFFKGYYNHCSNHCRLFWGEEQALTLREEPCRQKEKPYWPILICYDQLLLPLPLLSYHPL